jgi:hypothetical protein
MKAVDIRKFSNYDFDTKLVLWKMMENAFVGVKFTQVPENIFNDKIRELFFRSGFETFYDEGLKLWEVSWEPGFLKERHGL